MKVKNLEFIKKIFCVFLVLGIIILSLCSCSGNGNYVYDGEAQYYDDESEINDIHDLNIDLSEYSDHGELSCGRIWLEKEEGSWDEYPESQFAYFDADGNQITGWFLSDDFLKSNYENDVLIIRETEDYRNNGVEKGGYYYIYDLSGNELGEIAVPYYRWDIMIKSEREMLSTANENGQYLFYDSESDKYGYFDKDELNYFDLGENTIDVYSDSNFSLDKYKSHYIFIEYGGFNEAVDAFVLDSNFEIELNLTTAIGFSPYSAEVDSKNNIVAQFYGADDNIYQCVVDLQGNFIEEPTPLYD